MEHLSFIVLAFSMNDPIWQTLLEALGLVFALVGPPPLVSLLAYQLRKPKKRLSYQIESDVALVNLRKDLGEDMTIALKGGPFRELTEVDDVRLIMFRLVNTGSEIIRRKDFSYDEQRKIRFVFDEPVLILGSIHHTEPDYLIPLESRQRVFKLDSIPDQNVAVEGYFWRLFHISDEGVGRYFWKLFRGRDKKVKNCYSARLHKYADLEARTLDRNDTIVLKFVTLGHVPMHIEGHLLGGKIEPYTPPSPFFTPVRMGVSLAISIVFLVIILFYGPLWTFLSSYLKR